MSAQIYSLPDQTAGGKKSFLEKTSIDLSSKLSLTCWGNIIHYKSVHHPLPTLPSGTESTLVVFRTNQSAPLLSNESSDIFYYAN